MIESQENPNLEWIIHLAAVVGSLLQWDGK
jgi:hypothetical protein